MSGSERGWRTMTLGRAAAQPAARSAASPAPAFSVPGLARDPSLRRPALPAKSDILEVLGGPDRLQMHLQPVIELVSGAVWGLEALARFPGHPQPGPAEWFRAAMIAGWGPALETVALCGALDVLDDLPEDLSLSVNLSPTALLRPDVTELLLDASPGRLLVE